MDDFISGLIGLFGSISAISIAYLVLLYDQAQEKIHSSRESLIYEVEDSLKCCDITNETSLKEGNPFREDLHNNCRSKDIVIEDINKLINVLEKDIYDLRTKGEAQLSDSAFGKQNKIATHIEKYHKKDIEHALREYNSAENFYDEFPKRSKFAIGIPLIFSIIFITLYACQKLLIP